MCNNNNRWNAGSHNREEVDGWPCRMVTSYIQVTAQHNCLAFLKGK
jgi:hypothetical protein